MEELIKRLERVIQTGAPDKDGLHPISAETVLEVVKQLSEHGTNLAEVGTDLISRQAAIDRLTEYGNGRAVFISVGEAIIRIEQLPPAQPEPKMGKWERHYCEDGNPDGWQCDKCKEWYYFGQTLPNFCPNCGADMRQREVTNGN